MNIIVHYSQTEKDKGIATKYPVDADLAVVIHANTQTKEDMQIEKDLQEFQKDLREIAFESEKLLFAHDMYTSYHTPIGSNYSDWTYELTDLLLFLEEIKNYMPDAYTYLLHELIVKVDNHVNRPVYQLIVRAEKIPLTTYNFIREKRLATIDDILESL